MTEPGAPIHGALSLIVGMTEKPDANAKANTDILLTKAADPRPVMSQLITTLRDLSQDAAFRADGLEKLLAEYTERNG